MDNQTDFNQQINQFHQRINSLLRRQDVLGEANGILLEEALQELNISLEELQVADEELRQQNEHLAEAHASLELERKRYQELFEFAPDGYLVTDLSGNILEANRTAALLLNVDPEMLQRKPLPLFVHQTDRKLFQNLLKKAARQRGVDYEISLQPIKADQFSASLSFTRIHETLGTHQKLLWIIRDISERKKVQQALRESEEHFHAIFSRAETGIAILTGDGRVVESNAALQSMLSYKPDELVGRLWSDLTHPEDNPRHASLLSSLLEGETEVYRIEVRMLTKNSQVVWVRLVVSDFDLSTTTDPQVIVLAENITPQKEMQMEVDELRKRIVLGVEQERTRLSQNIHDGPLQDLYGVFYQVNQLISTMPENDERRELLRIRDSIQKIVGDLRMTSYDLRPPSLTHYGLQKAILSYLERFHQRYPSFSVYTDLKEDDNRLPDPIRLCLFRNFQHALINIVRHSHAKTIWVNFRIEPGQIVLEVRDDGVGFQPPQHLLDLAREDHLGLVSSIERAEALGGQVEIISAPQQGTTLRTTIPHATARAL